MIYRPAFLNPPQPVPGHVLPADARPGLFGVD